MQLRDQSLAAYMGCSMASTRFLKAYTRNLSKGRGSKAWGKVFSNDLQKKSKDTFNFLFYNKLVTTFENTFAGGKKEKTRCPLLFKIILFSNNNVLIFPQDIRIVALKHLSTVGSQRFRIPLKIIYASPKVESWHPF